MGKYLSVLIGAAVTLIGIVFTARWWGDFILILKGSIPVTLIFGGAIAVIAGLSELKDERRAKKEEKT